MHDWISPFRAEMPCQIFRKQWSADCHDGSVVEGDFVGTFIPVPIPTAEFRRWDRDEKKQIPKPYAKGCNIWCPQNIHSLCRVLDVGKRA